MDPELEPSDGRFNWPDYLKMVGAFLALIFAGLVVLYLVRVYQMNKQEQNIRALADALIKQQEAGYAAAMADTYGGKTPQETLQLYISAVEKGDYELASKYFIGDNQQKELESFKGATTEKVSNYLDLLRKSIPNGEFNDKKDYFSAYQPLLIRMKLYPNGIWKIIEI